MHSTKKDSTAKVAFMSSLPVMAGYIVLGIAFGILLEDKGYNFLWSLFMSVFIYAGSMQFVTVNLLVGGASLVSAAIMTFMVNARHLFYGITMLTKYKNMGKAKPYLIFGLTDETFALVCNGAPEGTTPWKYYLLVSIFDQSYWVTGSVIGSLIGSAITFNTAGIDFAMTALFVVIFTNQLMTIKDKIPAFVGLGCSIICLVIFGAANFLIPSMIAITAVLLIYGAIKGYDGEKEVQHD